MSKLIIENKTSEEICISSNVFSDQGVINPQCFGVGVQKTIKIESENGDIEISISETDN